MQNIQRNYRYNFSGWRTIIKKKKKTSSANAASNLMKYRSQELIYRCRSGWALTQISPKYFFQNQPPLETEKMLSLLAFTILTVEEPLSLETSFFPYSCKVRVLHLRRAGRGFWCTRTRDRQIQRECSAHYYKRSSDRCKKDATILYTIDVSYERPENEDLKAKQDA